MLSILAALALVVPGTCRVDDPDLAKLLRGDRADLARITAMGEDAIEPLALILADRGQASITRFMAANLLGDIGSKKAVQPLLDGLSDADYNVRRCSALALGKLRDERAREALLELAEKDPFAWKDPETGETRYLVREDARRAIELLDGRAAPDARGLVKEPEIFLDDASRPPPSPVKVRIRRLPPPFPGALEDQNVFNNYQQPTDDYVHAALDILNPPGTEVRAVDAGTVAVIATNYPEWKTHHFFIVTPEAGSDEGWCYTHVDPDTYTFEEGDTVRRGQVLGKLVDFYVGENKGADHLHLHYVRFQEEEDGKVEFTSLVDPLLFFDWKDVRDPVVHEPLRFVRAWTTEELPTGKDGLLEVSGVVDVVAGISDAARAGQGCDWMVPVVTIEILGEGSAPWRKLVLDQRGEIAEPRAAPALYLKSADVAEWKGVLPHFPVVHFLVATHTDGDGAIERADALHAWDTTQRTPEGKRRFPDGTYEVTVRAWDLEGNRGQRTAKVRVRNP